MQRPLLPSLALALVAFGACADNSPAGDAGPDDSADASPEPMSSPLLRITEIMYHPVGETSFADEHEFVEIHNAGDDDAELDGYLLSGGISYVFPEGAVLPAGGFLVVAKNRQQLLAVPAYAGLTPDSVLGDYQRSLDNGGDEIELWAPDGTLADRVAYDDEFPWPIGADALGAGESWLGPEYAPFEDHRYAGRSLQRISMTSPSSSPANWLASPLDEPTPGRANQVTDDKVWAVVERHTARPRGGGGPLIAAAEPVQLEIVFTAPEVLLDGPLGAAQVEYFVDDLSRTDEPRTTAELRDDGTGGDPVAGDHIFQADLPGQTENSIVRYRVLADRGRGLEVISPRPDDPYAWHAYFVSPPASSTTRTYQLFIAPDRWTSLWDNIGTGRVVGCQPSPTWGNRAPAVFVHEGVVHDVQVRYQGSRWNRGNGRDLASWPYPGPDRPSPVKALSWRVAFPRYAPFDDKRVVLLNKLSQACPGFNTVVGFELFRSVNVPAPLSRYVRLHINGGYYHYMLEIERPGEEFMQRYHSEIAEMNPDSEVEPVGHLFKAVGCNCDEGPYGWADGRLLGPNCGYSPEDRYRYTYDRKTHDWAGHDELIALIEGLHAARAQGGGSLRTYLQEHFDIELTLTYLAIINWAVPFDDYFQNHFLYQRRGDGKWLFVPWDLDRDFGGWKWADSSIYIGEQGDPDNRSGWWNYFKDSFLDVYRGEYETRLAELNATILAPGQVLPLIDAALTSTDPVEAAQAPAGAACDFDAAADTFRAFAQQRYQVVSGQ